ncbi:MAG TPA: hypothetical protein VL981_06175 [Candidatus Methylacidiphilales bacterium]|nr:hypothetical protein [Candidatus Methylacidiphilales bacterium]
MRYVPDQIGPDRAGERTPGTPILGAEGEMQGRLQAGSNGPEKRGHGNATKSRREVCIY